MNWYLAGLPIICLAVAVIELDDVHLGQFMLSRPFILGPLVGLIVGNAWLGIKMGILLELLTVDDLAVGNALPLNGSIAVTAAILLSAGPRMISPFFSLPAGILLGSLFRRVETVIRSKRANLTIWAEKALDQNKTIPFGKIILTALGWHVAAVWIFIYAGVLLLTEPMAWAWVRFPDPIQQGFHVAFQLTPWLGLATLGYAFRWRT